MTLDHPLAAQLVYRPEFSHLQDPGAGDPTIRGSNPAGTPQTGEPDPSGQPQQPCAPDSSMMMWMVLIFAVIYFMMIRPQQKQEKARRAMLSAVKKGDKVVTTGGMHGTVSNLTDETITLRADNMKLTFDRSAIARVLGGDGVVENPKG